MRRRDFILQTIGVGTGAATGLTRAASAVTQEEVKPAKRIKVGVVGCGSVSTKYLPHMEKCPYIEIASVCDRVPDRAQKAAAQHRVPKQYDDLEKMLAGEPFELLVNLTDIQSHYAVNKLGLQAGKNIWSEKTEAAT
ncbi:MAG: Gfo/Idh/MocA family oxidoreductase [Acidobacteria bacterium]|nr:Gfo/Idh/MocA family oxidoreductase [Acidobacteriota bacterium]MCI0722277.1 Gfo/Idh/MocA family oxidoreductase [Acidobacteriota bacterium]